MYPELKEYVKLGWEGTLSSSLKGSLTLKKLGKFHGLKQKISPFYDNILRREAVEF